MKDLDAVSLSSGPGSYTGLRVGAATAKAICYAMNIPLISVSTLESLALATVQSCLKDALFIPMIDARRMEVYTALFDADGNRMLSDQALVLHDSVFRTLFEAGERLVLSGDGSIKARDLFTSGNVDILDIRCSAQHLVIPAWRAYLGSQFEDIAYYTPNYLKAPNITKSSKTLV
jgi:tRNA threonylcarbamoyladenosine biosynthesis protein TsaB